MSSIRARNGKLVFDFNYRGIRCRETTKLLDNTKDRKIAEEILSRIEAEILLDQFDYGKYFPKSKKLKLFQNKTQYSSRATMTYEEFYKIWFIENSGPWRPTTKVTIQNYMNNHILPVLGHKKLNEITKSDLLLFRNKLIESKGKKNKKMGANHVNKIMMKCKAVLVEAACRYNFPDPSRLIKPLKKERTEVNPLTLQEVKKFLSVIRKDYKTYFTVRFFSGLRSSEINGLMWEDIDLKKGIIWVRRALVSNEIINTKTEDSYRMVEIHPLVISSLQQHKKNSNFNKPDDFVFLRNNGAYLSNDYVGKSVWHPTLRLLNLKPRALYQTRHTTASIWLASGESPEWIAKQLGHTTTEMLFRIYSRFVPNITRKDGVLFNQYINKAGINDHDDNSTTNDDKNNNPT